MKRDLTRYLLRIVENAGLNRNSTIEETKWSDPFESFAGSCKGAEGDVFLDGSDDHHGKGRYSVIAKDPLFILRMNGNSVAIRQGNGGDEILFNASLQEAINGLENILKAGQVKDETFFSGGLIFLLPYELNRFFEKLPDTKGDDNLPDLWCGFYPNVTLFDSLKKKAFTITRTAISRTAVSQEDEKRSTEPTSDIDRFSISSFNCDETKESYISKIKKIKKYIETGDSYQVNLSRKLTARFDGEPLALYKRLRSVNRSSYGAYINGGDFSLLSMSPEMFLKVRGRDIATMPIKGTAPRSATYEEDERLKQSLIESEKDKAENLMIVDLMRNDLSKVSVPNSVKVPSLFDVETLPTLHHLISTVTGKLKETATLYEILSAVFPGGSITGAPKIRTMEIILELETSPRGFYCGSLLAAGFNGTIDASILIRSITIKNGTAEYRTGGGITIDSNPEDEFMETKHKAEVLNKIGKKEKASV